MRLKNFNIEFPGTDNIEQEGLKGLAWHIPRCYSIDSLKMSFVLLPKIAAEDFDIFFLRFLKFKRVKHMSTEKLISFSRTTIGNNCTPAGKVLPKRPELKSITTKKGFKSGWYLGFYFLF